MTTPRLPGASSPIAGALGDAAENAYVLPTAATVSPTARLGLCA
jgi:hypothetical protein